jgi:pimeloyl-ACP methyl ester carboxylesterase/DNA-binding CsgD family transcriptional regulator
VTDPKGYPRFAVEQEIRFCTADDGVRLAYATHGRGPAIVKVANWVTHVEFDWRSPLWRHWWEELGRGHRVIRYDMRGCGLSDRNPEELSLDAFIGDLGAVVDAAGLDRFALLGISQGGAAAVRYAVEHPERVTHLVLCGAYARGRLQRDLTEEQHEENKLLQSIVRVGWGKPDPVFRRVFTSRFVPEASEEQMQWFDALMHVSTASEMAVRLRDTWGAVDVSDLLEKVAVPTLVAHARDEVAVPFEEGRLLATRIPGARFIPLESRNHVLLATEPAWQTFVDEVRAFLGTPRSATAQLGELSPREREVLRMVAQGCSNAEVADRLFISARTVERHLSNAYAKLGVSGRSARAAAAALFTRLEQGAVG